MGRNSGGGGVAGLRSFAARKGLSVVQLPSNQATSGGYKFAIRDKPGQRRGTFPTSMRARNITEARRLLTTPRSISTRTRSLRGR